MMTSIKHEPVVLTGIKPTGRPHLGNYLGTIRPALALAKERKALFFIADYHALTTMRDPARLESLIRELAATWIALGLDPDRVVFYRQSAVPEIFELLWALACIAPKGLLNRAHAYKAAVAANRAAGRDADADTNAGLFNYPLLMAADILAFDVRWVPVGVDQRQHVEIARDLAAAFNQAFGPVLVKPRAMIPESVQSIVGLDGRKMSKSYGNEIALMAAPDAVRERVMHIVTDSLRPEDPKDPERCNVFNIYRHFAAAADVERVRHRYRMGGLAYRRIKEELGDLLVRRFAPARDRFEALLADAAQLEEILATGARQARSRARHTVRRVRQAVGIEA